MILYTPLPHADVLAEENTNEYRYQSTASGVVLLEKQSTGEWVVQRLLSPDPEDYLHADYQPGTSWRDS